MYKREHVTLSSEIFLASAEVFPAYMGPKKSSSPGCTVLLCCKRFCRLVCSEASCSAAQHSSDEASLIGRNASDLCLKT